MAFYHSKYNETESNYQTACRASILPLKSGSVKGPAGEFKSENEDDLDIIDEALNHFKTNISILYKMFYIEGGADLTLIYLTSWISQCLRKLKYKNTKVM